MNATDTIEVKVKDNKDNTWFHEKEPANKKGIQKIWDELDLILNLK